MPDDFVHLHTHSDMSQLDGCGKISEYVKEAEKRGHKAIAMTDHGTMRGYMSLREECKGTPVAPIYGIEFYVSPDMHRRGFSDEEKAAITKDLKKGEHRAAIKQAEEREGIRDRWHITAWAQNQEGLTNLFRLSSLAFIEGFYYKPRIDLPELIKHSEGLFVSTGCLSSPINDRWILGRRKAALEFADRLQEAFGERMWLEIQPHAIPDQRVANELMCKLRDRYRGKNKLLATQDAHYVQQEDWIHHEVLLCIGTNDILSNPDRFKFDGSDFHFKTRKEMFASFRKNHPHISKELIKEALDSTLSFAEQCTAKVEVDYHKTLLPTVDIPERYKGNTFNYIRDLAIQGWTWRDIPRRAASYAAREGITREQALALYTNRLKMELGALRRQKFVDYILIVHDLYRFARERSIMTGPGRGSVAGSLCAYLLGITSVDPIEHGLIFERFISPDRIDMPDADMDFEDRRRGEIFEYVREKYGADKVCQIATIGKLSGKQCIRDVSRVLEIPLNEVNQVTHSIIERSSGDERASQTIEDSFKDFEVCRQFDAKYPNVLFHAKRLEGVAKQLGIHAAGVVASPVPLVELLPLETRKHEGTDVVVSAVDMYGVAAAGLVKFDVLGLRTLTVIKDALAAIEERHGRKIDMENPDHVNLNDPKVLAGFTAHDYGGVFQYDTPSADKVCSGVEFTSFEDVAAMTALNRPGTARSGLATKYVERKKNPKLVEKIDFHPDVSKITSDTLGIIVYQEHVLRIFTDIAGFPPATADSLRKTIAKKIGDETLGKERENFVKGALKKTPGMTEEVANKIMDAITFFGSYGFNKSHATAYGMIAFWGMWLKTYYPLEFYLALLKNEPDRIKVQQIAKDAKRHKIELKPPHVTSSALHFSIDNEGAIRGSLVDIKGVGENAAKAIIAAQPYKDFWDFVDRVERRKVHKGVVLALARAGALEGMLPNLRWFLENIEGFWKSLTGKKSARPELEAQMKASASEPDFTADDKSLMASQVNPLAFGRHPIDAYGSFLERHANVAIADMSDEDFFKDYDGKGCYIAGVIVEVKYNQIGDFHTGELPSEEERAKMFWGKRYANVNIEDKGGRQNRVKFDWDIFDRERPIIDRGVGTPVIVHATPMAFTGTLKAHFAVDIARYRQKVKAGEELDIWERVLDKRHPARLYHWKDGVTRKARVTNDKFWASRTGGVFTGLVTNVRMKYDSRGNLMAWVGLLGGDHRFIEVIVFASIWRQIRRIVKAGRLIKLVVETKPDSHRRRGFAHFYNGGKIKLLDKGSA